MLQRPASRRAVCALCHGPLWRVPVKTRRMMTRTTLHSCKTKRLHIAARLPDRALAKQDPQGTEGGCAIEAEVCALQPIVPAGFDPVFHVFQDSFVSLAGALECHFGHHLGTSGGTPQLDP